MSCRTLTVVADDAGLDRRIDDAILAAARAGTIQAAAVMATGPTACGFVRRARRIGIAIGLHLDLTEARPLGGCLPGLTDANGRWPGHKAALASAPPTCLPTLVAEVRRQWRRLRSAGGRPSFANGHNHVHALPLVGRALLLALDHVGADGVWIRLPRSTSPPPADLRTTLCAEHLDALEQGARPRPHPDAFVGLATMDEPTPAALSAELARVPSTARWVEWMVHPGGRRGTAFGESPAREREARWLTDRVGLERLLAKHGFTLGGPPA